MPNALPAATATMPQRDIACRVASRPVTKPNVERSTIIQGQRGANVKHQAIDESKRSPKHADTNLVIGLGHTTCARAQFFKKNAGHEMQRQQHAQGNLQGSEAKKREMRKSEGM